VTPFDTTAANRSAGVWVPIPGVSPLALCVYAEGKSGENNLVLFERERRSSAVLHNQNERPILSLRPDTIKQSADAALFQDFEAHYSRPD
jgi:hypothetical protein